MFRDGLYCAPAYTMHVEAEISEANTIPTKPPNFFLFCFWWLIPEEIILAKNMRIET